MGILRFDDIDNIEYRKGSKKFGGLLVKLMEFLRIHKNENNKIIFNINDFEKQSNIKINDIKSLLSDDKGKNLYKFDINIDNDNIIFTNLTSDKNRFFESSNKFFESSNSIRQNYEILGVQDFYKTIGDKYINPHEEYINNCIIDINKNNLVNFNNVLDLGCGKGEITNILKQLGYDNIVGCDPYLYKEYTKNTNKKCYKYSFDDIQKGSIDDKKYSTIICSYSMHLAKPSIIPELLWKLSLISEYLIILSPNNNPIIRDNNGWELLNEFKKGKCKCRIYKSINKNLI